MNKRSIRRGIILGTVLASFVVSAFAAGYTTLRYRDQGSDVLKMQQALVSLGYSTGGTDGKFGPTTEKAVRQFQRANGLTVDGLAGNATLTLLYQQAAGGGTSTPTTPSEPTTGDSSSYFGGNYATLKYGSRGDRVKLLQRALNDLGYSAGTADGKFGAGTQQAVVRFQRANGLTADGLAGKKTLQRIEALLAGDTGGSITPDIEEDSSSSSTIPTRTLRKGYQGDDVKSVQTRLKALGYYTGTVDGKYGTGSMAAVKAFQQAHGLTADGLAGTKTYNILFSDSAKPAGSTTTPDTDTVIIPTRTLRKGYQGDDVKSVQNRLKALGYYTGTVDGKYGTGSMAAVKAFQQAHGLTADGLAGTKTYNILFSDEAKPAGSTSVTPSTPTTPSYAIPTRTLRKNDTGDDVASLQSRLKELGYYTTLVDGSFGNGTVEAVTAFQKQHGLTADGVAGSKTYAILYSASAQKAPAAEVTPDVPADQPTATMPEGGWKTLKLDSTGAEVTQLQQALEKLNYPVSVSKVNEYDQATRWAVECFQRRNGLTVDGVAGSSMQAKLYGGSAVAADTVLSSSVAKGVAPGGADLEVINWYDSLKAYLQRNRNFTVYEPVSGKTWKMRLYSAGEHADSEPLTAEDSKIMYEVWGNQWSWDEKPVYIQLANGTWCIASMPNMPHLSGSLSDNDFNGHTCVHFPRYMKEVQQNAPDNGGRHNRDIRVHWLKLTGEEIPW